MGNDWTRDDENFAENVRRRREGLGWSREELSKLLRGAGMDNMHPTTVARLETGRRAPRLGEARGIARVLAVELDYLIAPPEAVNVGDRLRVAESDVNSAYQRVIQAAEQLHAHRKVLELAVRETATYEAEGWYAEALATIRRGCDAALVWLTGRHAIEDHAQGDDEEAETFYDLYRQAATGRTRTEEEDAIYEQYQETR